MTSRFLLGPERASRSFLPSIGSSGLPQERQGSFISCIWKFGLCLTRVDEWGVKIGGVLRKVSVCFADVETSAGVFSRL